MKNTFRREKEGSKGSLSFVEIVSILGDELKGWEIKWVLVKATTQEMVNATCSTGSLSKMVWIGANEDGKDWLETCGWAKEGRVPMPYKRLVLVK